MTVADADNLDVRVNQNEEVVIEPSYLGFMRAQGFQIEAIKEMHSVPSESGEGMHLLLKVKTYRYPKYHPQLDVASDSIDVWVCDCWSYRNSTNDIADGEYPPDGDCKHIQAVDKVERAKADQAQDTLL